MVDTGEPQPKNSRLPTTPIKPPEKPVDTEEYRKKFSRIAGLGAIGDRRQKLTASREEKTSEDVRPGWQKWTQEKGAAKNLAQSNNK